MTNVMTNVIISGIGSFVKSCCKLTLEGIGLIATYAYFTQPDEKSFDLYLNSLITKDSGWLVDKLVGITTNTLFTKTFKNFLFFRLVTVYPLTCASLSFIGIFQNWYPIKSNSTL